MKPVLIPDVCPMDLIRKNPGGHDMSMCAGEFLEVYGKQSNEWNAVLACFFIDTAPNIFEYMEVIHRILKPGGLLISIGPLQFHWAEDFGDDERYSRSIEMSYDEIKHVIQSYVTSFSLSPCFPASQLNLTKQTLCSNTGTASSFFTRRDVFAVMQGTQSRCSSRLITPYSLRREK